MPELPDVEVLRRYLDATALHQRIARVERLDPALVHGTSSARLRAVLAGASLERTRRHGKWLFARCGDGPWLVLHFGMTGGLAYLDPADCSPVHTRMLLAFENGHRLAYVCQRKLGRILIADDVDGFVTERRLGPDAFDLDIDGLLRALGRGRGAAKPTLLNQHAVAGLGNVYSDEALFQAGLHPRTPMNTLDGAARRSLARRIRHVLATAVERGANPDDLPRSWLLPRRHLGATCPRCGSLIRRTRLAGRSAYYCPNCQPAPSGRPEGSSRDALS